MLAIGGQVVMVVPLYMPEVRGLCVKPYPLHPKGCPNFGKKQGCPPSASRLPDVFRLDGRCYAIINGFNLGMHVARMREKHPQWSQRQLECCLYWQGAARSQLEDQIAAFTFEHPEYRVERCPEAMGLNVAETLRSAGLDMEWPPVNVAMQVAFAGLPRETFVPMDDLESR
jgi:predicted metal-binding protein